jgi:AcrR family transcriptional regulator/DNA-binding MarR family transcriptional regulator
VRPAPVASRVRSGSGGVGWRRAAGSSAGGVSAAGRLVEIQRSRLLVGAVAAIEELGYAHATVTRITSRARVSRRTFYEIFENRDECLAAVLEDVVGMVERELVAADLGGLVWRERVCGGLRVILAFFDREPVIARVCVVQALRGGARVLEGREEILARLASVIDEGRGESVRGRECTAVTAEGLVGAAAAVVYARLLRRDAAPLVDLLGELMALIVLPYLGPAAARREQTRQAGSVVPAAARAPVAGGVPVGAGEELGALGELPIRLTYRTVRALECIAGCPGSSNRLVSERAGVSDQGQISKLLARLERLGLIVNSSEGHAKGEPNAWALTPLGREVTERLSISARHRGEAA